MLRFLSAALCFWRVAASGASESVFRADAYYSTEDIYYHGVSYRLEKSYVYSRPAATRFQTKTTIYNSQNVPTTVTDYNGFDFECLSQTFETFTWADEWGTELVYWNQGTANAYLYANYSLPPHSGCTLKAGQYELKPWWLASYLPSSLTNIVRPITNTFVAPPAQRIWLWDSLIIEFSSPLEINPVIGPIRG